MAALKFLVFLAVAMTCTFAEEEERTKKDILMQYDDGSYWPGKYEAKSYPAIPAAEYHHILPYASYHPAGHHVVSPVMPYAYSHIPIAKSIVY